MSWGGQPLGSANQTLSDLRIILLSFYTARGDQGTKSSYWKNLNLISIYSNKAPLKWLFSKDVALHHLKRLS